MGELLSHAKISAGKSQKDALQDPKSAKWKIQITRQLRGSFTATNGWIAEHLHMGHPTRVCNLVRGEYVSYRTDPVCTVCILSRQRGPMAARLAELAGILQARRVDIAGYEARIQALESESGTLGESIAAWREESTSLEARNEELQAVRAKVHQSAEAVEIALRAARQQLVQLQEQKGRLEVRIAHLEMRMENARNHVSHRYQTDLEAFEPDSYALICTFRDRNRKKVSSPDAQVAEGRKDESAARSDLMDPATLTVATSLPRPELWRSAFLHGPKPHFAGVAAREGKHRPNLWAASARTPPLRPPPSAVSWHTEIPEARNVPNFSRRGGIGRRARLKIVFPSGVWVRSPPPAKLLSGEHTGACDQVGPLTIPPSP